MGEALRVLRDAAAATRPFTVLLGPPTTFLPDNPTLHLPVSGQGLETLQELRHRVFLPPLERALTWPFVPHVTLADEMTLARIAAAIEALAGYRAVVNFERVHLLEEHKGPGGRVWRPLADAAFAAPAVVGRGGIELELSVTDALDPEAVAFAAREWDDYRTDTLGPEASDRRPFAIVARRVGAVAGVAEWLDPRRRRPRARPSSLPTSAARGVGRRLLAAFRISGRRAGLPPSCPADVPPKAGPSGSTKRTAGSRRPRSPTGSTAESWCSSGATSSRTRPTRTRGAWPGDAGSRCGGPCRTWSA